MSDAEAERRMAGDQPASKKRSAEEGGAAETEMAALERQAARIVEATSKAPAADPNEIDLDDDDSDDEVHGPEHCDAQGNDDHDALDAAMGDAHGGATAPTLAHLRRVRQ